MPDNARAMLENLKADIDRHRRFGSTVPTWRLLAEDQGLWAVVCYRAGHWLETHRLPPGIRQLALIGYHLWHLAVRTTTGIHIPPDCRIGPGLYIGHFGGIILHPEVRMGTDCNLSQGVTIGAGGRGARQGVPWLGDRVYVAPGAKVFGPIRVADGTVVGANAVLTRDTEPDAVMVGVPARQVSRTGSADFMGRKRDGHD